jgi:hypothetical protein
VGRHSVYISSGSNLTVGGCNFYEHRAGATLQSYSLAALQISRANNVTATNNNFIGCNDTCVAVLNGSPSGACFNVSIKSNTFSDYARYGVLVGTDSPDVNGQVNNVLVGGNNFKHRSNSALSAVLVLHCDVLRISDNIIDASSLTVDNAAIISLYGYGSSNPSDNYHIANNSIVMPETGISTARAITVQSNVCTGSQLVYIRDNIIKALTDIHLATGQTNTSLIISRLNALAKSSTLVIASGEITATANRHIIDTESAAASDDLDTINGGVDGKILVLSTLTSGRDVTVKDNTGNIRLAGDFALSTTQDILTLIYDSTSNFWHEVSRSNNA